MPQMRSNIDPRTEALVFPVPEFSMFDQVTNGIERLLGFGKSRNELVPSADLLEGPLTL